MQYGPQIYYVICNSNILHYKCNMLLPITGIWDSYTIIILRIDNKVLLETFHHSITCFA